MGYICLSFGLHATFKIALRYILSKLKVTSYCRVINDPCYVTGTGQRVTLCFELDILECIEHYDLKIRMNFESYQLTLYLYCFGFMLCRNVINRERNYSYFRIEIIETH